MITKERARAAVRALAEPHSENKARLMSFVDSIPHQELAEWGIEDTDDDQDIYYYILVKAQGSPPAAAGVKTPAVEDPAVAAMMRALRSQAVPAAPGEVLRLEGGAVFLMHQKLSGLYIRDCYKQLADLMLAEPPLEYILTGTPGIGKSLFIYYLLARLLHLPEPPPYIVWQHMFKHNRRYCFNVKTSETRWGGLDSFEAVELGNPDTWYITDGVPPDVGVKARILLVTSPKRETYKEMEKASAVKLFMPLWSLEELQDCRSKVGTPVPEALVTKFFQYCGGVARYPLEHRRPPTQKTFDALLNDLRGAVDACSVAQVRAAVGDVGAQDMGPESSHRVIHIETDASYSRRQLVFASPWMAERFMDKALEEDERGLVSLVNGTTGSLRGMLHEALMHMLLPKGGGFTVAPVVFPDGMEKLQRGPEQRLKLPKCKGVALFEDVAEIAGERCVEGVYYKPTSPTFPLVDSLLYAGGALNLFQMTAGGSKPVELVEFAALDELLREMSLASQPEPRLIFVVPEDVYPTFKLSVKVGNEDKGQAAVVEGGRKQAPAEAPATASAKGRPRKAPAAASAKGRPRRAQAPALAPAPPAPVPAPVARPKLYIMKVRLATRTKVKVRAVCTQSGRPAARMLSGLRW